VHGGGDEEFRLGGGGKGVRVGTSLVSLGGGECEGVLRCFTQHCFAG